MSAFSAALVGGGVKGGRAIGSTDSQAAVVRDNPKHPQDVLATVYRHLGVDPTINDTDHAGRPHPVLSFGKPIDELFYHGLFMVPHGGSAVPHSNPLRKF